MYKDTFRVVIPAEFEKSADGDWRIGGLASTSAMDQQGEVLIQKGIDLSPIDQKKGCFNWDHNNSPENIIGVVDGYKQSEKGLYVSGRLFKNHTKAKAVREIMESLDKGDRGRLGMSVEGKIVKRNTNDPRIIEKCVIKNIALTMNPVNTDTFADIVKSMTSSEVEFDSQEEPATSEAEHQLFTASQVMAIVQKALSLGAGSMGSPDAKTGGDALQPSDMKAEKCKKCGLMKCEHVKKGEEDADGSVFSSKPSEILKGGDGSGVKGHMTAQGDKHPMAHVLVAVREHGNGYGAYGHSHREEGARDKHGVTDADKDMHTAMERHKLSDHDKALYYDSKHGRHGMDALSSGQHDHVDSTIKRFKEEKSGLDSEYSKKFKDALKGESAKKPMKKMSKDMYKSNLINVLDKLQVLYPSHSRSEIWEAVKERLETKFEKGGPGSGKKGHKTSDKYDVHKHPRYGTEILSHKQGKDSASSKEREDLEREADEVTDNAVQSWKQHSDDELREIISEHKAKKGLRIHSTSGKEREHKLYEDARQRSDYETNKDKSRAQLNTLADESGGSKMDKQKIRAQRDAAIQAGEDRDHVRPNVKG